MPGEGKEALCINSLKPSHNSLLPRASTPRGPPSGTAIAFLGDSLRQKGRPENRWYSYRNLFVLRYPKPCRYSPTVIHALPASRQTLATGQTFPGHHCGILFCSLQYLKNLEIPLKRGDEPCSGKSPQGFSQKWSSL